MIPFIDLAKMHENIIEEYLEELRGLFKRCDFMGTTSHAASAFEDACADYLGVKYALGVASGTDALLLALRALDIKSGDEVIVPAFGFIATADVVLRLGARPVFVDIDPVTYNIDPALIEEAVTDRTRAIIPVHLYGQACDMSAIMEIAQRRGIAVIEDVAQSFGAEHGGRKTGTIGALGAFSFYPTKNLGGAGDGGLVTTNDEEIAVKLRKFRDHGRDTKGAFVLIGYNSRLDTIQAIYLHLKLPELNDNLMDRIENARFYNEHFKDTNIITPPVPDDMSHTFNLYTMRVRERDQLKNHLKKKGVQSAVYYREAMHMMPALQSLGLGLGAFPQAEKAAGEVISLPVWPGLKKREIEHVVAAVLEFVGNSAGA
ncbi:MAG: DegT/DnrJ/EryC1/StrS family aminotransferase [bacterium]|nr:DegT/DnrJ/EryC1/StrS family aminotransferase [Candidatus Sumerlaeota bacterium]